MYESIGWPVFHQVWVKHLTAFDSNPVLSNLPVIKGVIQLFGPTIKQDIYAKIMMMKLYVALNFHIEEKIGKEDRKGRKKET